MMDKKGISPLLASVLLFAITVSVAGVFAQFAPSLLNSVTDSASNQTTNQIRCEAASVEVIQATYDPDDEEMVTVVRNNGDVELNVTSAVFLDGRLAERTSSSLSPGQTQNYEETGLTSEPERVTSFSEECGSVRVETQNIRNP